MPAAGLAGCDALILLVPKFTAASVPADGKLAVVARFGVGYDSVDVPACTENGHRARDHAGRRAPAGGGLDPDLHPGADAASCLIKDRLCRQGPDGWAKRSDHMGVGLVGKTLGQLGMGNIGAEVFRLAQPFGMKFIAHDPFAKTPRSPPNWASNWSGSRSCSGAPTSSRSTCRSATATQHIVGERLLGLMKPTAYVINTARGPVVDQKALHRALTDGTHRRRRPRCVRGRAVPGRRADPPARQCHRGPACAVLDRRMLRRQRCRRREGGAGGACTGAYPRASSIEMW